MITVRNHFVRKVDCNQTKMDLVANSIQRALTSKCVVKASEQKVKEQTSDFGVELIPALRTSREILQMH